MDQRECSRISRRTSLRKRRGQRGGTGKEDNKKQEGFPFRAATRFTTRRHHRLEDESQSEMEMSEGKKKKKGQMVNNSLAEFLWFNEDVEVGFLELLSEHAEDIRGGREISQVVNDQVEQQLTREVWRERRITSQ